MRGACLVRVVPADLIIGKVGRKESGIAVQNVGQEISACCHSGQLGAWQAAGNAVEPVKQEFHEVSAALRKRGGRSDCDKLSRHTL